MDREIELRLATPAELYACIEAAVAANPIMFLLSKDVYNVMMAEGQHCSHDLTPVRGGDGGIAAADFSASLVMPFPKESQTRYKSNLERFCRQVSKTCAISSHSQ